MCPSIEFEGVAVSTIGSESVELGMEVFVTSAGQIDVHGQPYQKYSCPAVHI